jgi:hypothetical protein
MNQKILDILEPFYEEVVDFWHVTGLDFDLEKPMNDYRLPHLKAKHLVALHDLYLALLDEEEVIEDGDFAEDIEDPEDV